MESNQKEIQALHDIRRMMERSSRFISLSGWSGISAGLTALIGAYLANYRIGVYTSGPYEAGEACASCLKRDLILMAAGVFAAAFISAMLFTVQKSRREGVAIWGNAARRLIWNTILPLIAGGFIILRMMMLKQYELIAGASLIIYGLALINGSKYTIGEIRWLGYAEIVTGIIGLWSSDYGLWLWAFGFGVLHIFYGIAMWLKYERRKPSENSFAGSREERS